MRHGTVDLGTIDPLAIETQRTPVPVILLGGRAWRVLDVDWRRRIASVEPAGAEGRSRWFGSSRALHADLARSVERVLVTGEAGVNLSKRASAALEGLREHMTFVDGNGLPVVTTGDETRLWTFAGGRANAMLATALRSSGIIIRTADNFGVTLRGVAATDLKPALDGLAAEACPPPVPTRALSELKFGACLPEQLAQAVLRQRLADPGALHDCLERPRRWISPQG